MKHETRSIYRCGPWYTGLPSTTHETDRYCSGASIHWLATYEAWNQSIHCCATPRHWPTTYEAWNRSIYCSPKLIHWFTTYEAWNWSIYRLARALIRCSATYEAWNRSIDRSPNLIHWFATYSELTRAKNHSEKSPPHLLATGGAQEPIILRNRSYKFSPMSLTSFTLIQGIMVLLEGWKMLSLPLCTAQQDFNSAPRDEDWHRQLELEWIPEATSWNAIRQQGLSKVANQEAMRRWNEWKPLLGQTSVPSPGLGG